MRILIVDDSDEDYDVMLDCFQRRDTAAEFQRCKSGDEVEPFLARSFSDQTLPQLIVLDLNLIGKDGKEVLGFLKQSENFRHIPVLIFSTSSNRKDIDSCYALGANSYSCKPVDLTRFDDFIGSIVRFWMHNSQLPVGPAASSVNGRIDTFN